ncbi:cytosolic carboxypeptidase 1-like isoform X2 [Macrobrachium rosenbergii]|uniref:cytosolic carboxypeptidase 1-like isoform X2 n=1 Tax=Macrobrachium rosenbergii TaxID=79674 RepID=UPI0034D3DCDD
MATEEDPLSVTLDRLTQAVTQPVENMDTIKTLISRLHSKLKVQESSCISVCGTFFPWSDYTEYFAVVVPDAEVRLSTLAKIIPPERQTLEQLVHLIEVCREPSMVTAVCSLLHDALSPSNKGDIRDIVIQTCLALNTAEVILRTLKSLSTEGLTVIEPCVHPAYQVLAKLASKDPKLAVKARLVGGVKLTHQLLQAHMKNNVPLLPLLMVTKYLAKNSTNQVMLGKDGCVATLAAILTSVPKTHWAKIKFIMEILALLTKAKSNVIRLVRETGLQRVLSIFDGWEKIERRHQIKILKSILGTLSHMCDSKHGRKAVMALNGVEITQRFIQSCPADKKFDSALASATNVFLKCISKGELPVSSTRGAFKFQVANREESDSTAALSREATPGLDADSSDDELEDEMEEEEEDFDLSREMKGVDLSSEYSVERPRTEELVRLAPLFPELSNYKVQSGTRFKDVTLEARRGNVNDSSPDAGTDYYLRASDSTKSIISFVKVAYPDMIGARGPMYLEELYDKDRKVCRSKAIATVERVLHPEIYMERVVYDLDYLLESEHSRQLITPASSSSRSLSNWDEKRVGKKDVTVNHLNFESRFESGNLRRVIQASNTEYDLILNADVNSSHHHQWFYFEVSNMEPNTQYTFNIINNEKPNSEFNFGMKPVMFSVREALLGRPAWVRTGSNICYHKNHYSRIPKCHDNVRFKKSANKSYYTATFTVTFPHAYDVCYLAYHYPYTYTQLQAYLSKLDNRNLPSDIFYCSQLLCHTLNGNPVPLLTITSKDTNKTKEVVFLTARVHPGESNSSWVMEGVVDFILGGSVAARLLLDKFVFKIVPMLNPEGVIHGNQRCGLTDEDLNRRWRSPNPQLHPTICHSKSLLEYLVHVAKQKVRVFCDFHGHSRQKNVFMYGCSRLQSWWPGDKDTPDSPDFMLLPRLAQNCMGTFSLRDCHFQIERAREATARVAVWRQFDIPMSYTMEASTCGCDQGPYKNYHLSPKELIESGEGFCLALSYLVSTPEVLNSRLLQDSERVDHKFGMTKERNLGDFTKEVAFWSGELDDDLDSDDDLDLDLYGPM